MSKHGHYEKDSVSVADYSKNQIKVNSKALDVTLRSTPWPLLLPK